MTDRFVRIIADDLTGALDTSAPFASPKRPMRVLVGTRPRMTDVDLAGVSTSSESRDVPWRQAKTRVQAAFERLSAVPGPAGSTPVYFAKVDSVLRGHPFRETQLRCALWHTEHCLFAPAFPDMGRRTVEGYHQILKDDCWQNTMADCLVDCFERIGTSARLRREADRWPLTNTGFVIGDATSSAGLRAHVQAVDSIDSLVWAGSRGLAEALAGPPRPLSPPRLSHVLIGTRHTVTQTQIEYARRAGLWDRIALTNPAVDTSDADQTRAHIVAASERLDPSHEQGLLISGGDTLSWICTALDVDSLYCEGEIVSGLPLSRIEGGPLDGLSVVTKSGGFGRSSVLLDILDRNR